MGFFEQCVDMRTSSSMETDSERGREKTERQADRQRERSV